MGRENGCFQAAEALLYGVLRCPHADMENGGVFWRIGGGDGGARGAKGLGGENSCFEVAEALLYGVLLRCLHADMENGGGFWRIGGDGGGMLWGATPLL